MLNEDEEPKINPLTITHRSLDRLGIDELRSYIVALQAEVSRVEAEIAKKSDHRNAADKFFRSPK